MYTTIEENGKKYDIKATIKGVEYSLGSIEKVYNNSYCAFVTGIGQIQPSEGLLFDSVEAAQTAIVEKFKYEYGI